MTTAGDWPEAETPASASVEAEIARIVDEITKLAREARYEGASPRVRTTRPSIAERARVVDAEPASPDGFQAGAGPFCMP